MAAEQANGRPGNAAAAASLASGLAPASPAGLAGALDCLQRAVSRLEQRIEHEQQQRLQLVQQAAEMVNQTLSLVRELEDHLSLASEVDGVRRAADELIKLAGATALKVSTGGSLASTASSSGTMRLANVAAHLAQAAQAAQSASASGNLRLVSNTGVPPATTERPPANASAGDRHASEVSGEYGAAPTMLPPPTAMPAGAVPSAIPSGVLRRLSPVRQTTDRLRTIHLGSNGLTSTSSGGHSLSSILAAGQEVPLTKGIEQLLGQVGELVTLVNQMEPSPVIPGTTIPVDADFRAQALSHANALLDQFNLMHDECRARARQRLVELASRGTSVTDPLMCWDADALRRYHEFRTRVVVEKLLDPLELRAQQLTEPEYAQLVAHLARTMGLSPLAIMTGETVFNGDFHESVDFSTQKGNAAASNLVIRVMLSGYVDVADNLVVRKAFVKTGPASTSGGALEPPRQPAKVPLAEMSVATDMGEIMLPAEVKTVKGYVLRLSAYGPGLPASEMARDLRGAANPEMKALVADLVARFCKQFLAFHERSKSLAYLNLKRMTAADPNGTLPDAGWDEHLIYEYRAYRTKRFIEECLDPLEAQASQNGMQDGLRFVDVLAVEMKLSRMLVQAPKTLFDPDRHQLDGRVSIAGMNPARQPIARLIKSGYVDLATGDIIRRATVAVNFAPLRPAGKQR